MPPVDADDDILLVNALVEGIQREGDAPRIQQSSKILHKVVRLVSSSIPIESFLPAIFS